MISNIKKEGGVRTRFAPSPTGFLHIGGARTALFNYLFAKKNNGVFVLRIEDTDTERSEKRFEQAIFDGLEWLGIKWDEGPYKQSERIEIYKKYLEKLLEEGRAYYCFCSEEELEAQRQYQQSIGQAPKYNGKCSNLSQKEAEEKLAKGEKSVIRFRVPSKTMKFKDMIRGEVGFDLELMGDMVIAKDLNSPLYNFSVVVDDYEMKITHVIRGEEHLANTPKQILIQEALEFNTPIYAHIPLILAPDRTKLSKRQGATSVFDFKEMGYLPEAIINFIAFLGWNPGDDSEIYSLEELEKVFLLERVQRSPAIFNDKKLDSINGFYIRNKTREDITELALPFLQKAGLVGNDYNLDYLKDVIGIHQERLKRISEIVEIGDYFFKKTLEYEKAILLWKDMNEEECRQSIDKSIIILSEIEKEDWVKENLEKKLLLEAERIGDKGKLLWPLRVALTGKQASAGPFEVAAILGKERCLERLARAKELL